MKNLDLGVEIGSVKQYGAYETVGPVRLPLRLERGDDAVYELTYFGFSGGRYATVMSGDVRSARRPLIRISSECVWGNTFGSRYCDCRWQMEESLARIKDAGCGMLVYAFDQHGKGVGLRNHFLVYAEGQRRNQELVVDAYTSLGFQEDYRNYEDVGRILSHYDICYLRLLTNSPGRIEQFRSFGFDVEREALECDVNRYNYEELITKRKKLGHLLSLTALGDSGTSHMIQNGHSQSGCSSISGPEV